MKLEQGIHDTGSRKLLCTWSCSSSGWSMTAWSASTSITPKSTHLNARTARKTSKTTDEEHLALCSSVLKNWWRPQKNQSQPWAQNDLWGVLDWWNHLFANLHELLCFSTWKHWNQRRYTIDLNLKHLRTWSSGTNVKKNGLKVFMDNRIHVQDHNNWHDTGARSPSVQQKPT